LIIDAIQYATELLPYIKIQVDNAKSEGKMQASGMYLLTGSQMFKMMKGVSETLAGRVSILNLYGLTTSEIQQNNQEAFLPTFSYIKTREENPQLSLEQIFERIYRGSFPELIKNKNMDSQEYYSSYLQTYLERDIRDIITLKDETKFLKFISCVATRTAQELVYEDIARDVEVDIKTAKEWLSILRSSGLVYLLQPYSNNNIKRIIKRPKIYFMDICIITEIAIKEKLIYYLFRMEMYIQ
jgi:predicted AAA+ superfamily ATPase